MSISKIQIGATRRQRKKATDVRPAGAELYLLPVLARVPLKFGAETLTAVTCARVRLNVVGQNGRAAVGWGETPLNVQWTWPGDLSYAERHQAMIAFCFRLAETWVDFDAWGHPLELGNSFQLHVLPNLIQDFNRSRPTNAHLPYLAALVCCSPFDIALHDAYGKLHDVPTYATYGRSYMNCDLAELFATDDRNGTDFRGKYPSDFLSADPARALPVWHLVGGLDPLDECELSGDEPDDGYPLVLTDWIDRDGLTCLKVKLRGDDAHWDYERLVRVGQIGTSRGVSRLTADFNCMVQDPAYVNEILDRLKRDEPAIFDMIMFVEQPFPYELEKFQIDVRSVSRRKPLLLDESAHDWLHVKRGADLGWTGVALKTCKTQTGVLLSLCWARAHNMMLMVQDLTNPMLAQIPHVLLAAHANPVMGVESNSMQFYPDASLFEAHVHPGLYVRRKGMLDLSSIAGSGFGYRIDEINRPLHSPVQRCGEINGSSAPAGPHFLGKKSKSNVESISPRG
jgi:L-alanine-DL-glutamate epimerase-like enolase superfamily enzyme